MKAHQIIELCVIHIFLNIIIIILLNPLFIPEVSAHNNITIIIPISVHPIVINAQTNEEEWDDAFKINFTSSGREGAVVIFLKYEVINRTLDGAFLIPDSTLSDVKGKLDQISFGFDTIHAARNITDPSIHQIVFGRDKLAEYHTGKNKGGYDWKINTTENQHTFNINNPPFSKVSFNTISDEKIWKGEFKIYFTEDPRLYGFAINQVDFVPDGSNEEKRFFNSFPANNKTDMWNPSTWGDIRISEVVQYINGMKNFCSSDALSGIMANYFLCIRSPTPVIEEGTNKDIVVEGRFADIINSTGIGNEQIGIKINNQDGTTHSPFHNLNTRHDGKYDGQYPNPDLAKGTYYLVAEPTSERYSGLNATTRISVTERVPTIHETLTNLGTYAAAIGALVGIVVLGYNLYKHIVGKKQRNNLYDQMTEINGIFYTSSKNIEEGLKNLKHKKENILQSLNNGEISEEQYGMLDDKISEYEEKLKQRI